MTDEEALVIASKGGGWVDWNHDLKRPDWLRIEGYEPTIRLDGEFTAKELLAILHFAPKEQVSRNCPEDCGRTYEKCHRGSECEFVEWLAKKNAD